jgi:hypothetical protein
MTTNEAIEITERTEASSFSVVSVSSAALFLA